MSSEVNYVQVTAVLLMGQKNVDDYPKTQITYSFMDYSSSDLTTTIGVVIPGNDLSNDYEDFVDTYRNLSSGAKKIVREVMFEYSEITSGGFTEITNYSGNETIMFGAMETPTRGLGPVAGVTLDQTHPDPDYKSYIMLNKDFNLTLSDDTKRILRHTVRHEALHALGFVDFKAITPNAAHNNNKYTVMSYNNHESFISRNANGVITGSLYPTTFMMLDYELFKLLGILTDHNEGDNSGENAYTFKSSKVLETVYDTGGINEFNFEDSDFGSRGVIADLRQGHFSSVGESFAINNTVAIENVGIAYGTVIQNVTGSDEADVLIGNVEDNIMKGGDGNDFIYGDGLSYDATQWTGWETHQQTYAATVGPGYYENTDLVNESGNDQLFGEDGDDHLFGGEGNDVLDGGDDHDTLNGGEGYDVLKGGKGTDTYVFDTQFGKDQIIDADGKGTIVIGGITLGTLKLVEGTDIVYRDSVENAKFEIIKINNGTTTDLLISALGSDGGQILVKNWSDAAGSNLGITLDNTVAEDTATRTEIIGNSNHNAISLDNLRDNNASFNIEAVTHTLMNGGEGTGKDIVMGMADTGDKIIGGDGDDILSGGFTNSLTNSASHQLTPAIDQPAKDFIDGGIGNDSIFSQVGGSVAHGGADNDTLYAGFGGYFFIDDIQLLAANADQGIPGHAARSRDEIYADVINTINFSHVRTQTPVVVDGQTLISEGFELKLDYLNNLTGDFQKFETTTEGLFYIGRQSGVPSNVDKTDVSYAFAGQYNMSYNYQEKDGVLSIINRNDSLPFYFTGGNFKPGVGKTIEDYASLKGANLYGDEGDDLLLGGMFADYLSGGADSDFIRAGAGHDIVDGGDGADFLYGQDGDDIVLGGKDNDHIWGESGKDNLFGGDGDDYISGGENDDYLVGGVGKDSLWGNEGDDILVMSKEDSNFEGGAGNDLYIIDDFIFTETQVNAAQSGNTNTSPYLVSTQNGKSTYIISIDDEEGNDTLALTGLTNFSSIGARAQNSDVVLTIGDTSIYVINAMQGSIDKIVSGESADAIQQGQITQQINISDFIVENVSSSVNIIAQQANTEVMGGRINDSLTANIGGSQLRGGKGNDQLNGEIGNDTYLYSLNDGNDTITEKGGNNTIKFAVGITADMVDVKRINGQLQLHISNGHIIRVNNMFDANGAIIQINAIQQIQFADGTVWDQTRLLQEIVKPRSVTGTDFSEVLIGGEGNDTLNGKKGNDQLQGGIGDDTYQFSATDGEDTILDTQGNDRILFDNTVDENSIIVRRDAQNNLLINIVDPLLTSPLPGGGAVSVGSNSTGSNAIESIQFDNGSIWDSAKIETEIAKNISLTQIGTNTNDNLKGDTASNIFIGNQGNDTLIGGAANDTYQYASGDGSDVIRDTDGIDKIKFTNITDPSSVMVERSGDHLLMRLVDGSVITVEHYFAPKAANVVDPKITAIIDQLQNRWLAQTEKLIEQHYGLTATGKINIRFATGIDSPEAAHVEYTYANGSSVPTSLTLEIDLTDFADVLNNPNGNAPVYFDRVIAHEMAHALMSMNMNMTQLPGWFTEGTAELIHGADERVKADEGFLNVEQNFIGLFKTTVGSPSHTAGYSISYLAVKLLDKEIRDNGGVGIKEIFDQLKTGKTLDQAFIAVSTAHPGLQTIWTSLVSFENHFKEIGFTQYETWVKLNDLDTGSIAGSDYGFAVLTAESVVPDATIGSPTGLQLTIPENYIPSPQINGVIETIEFADGTIWNQSQILVEIDKTFNRSFSGTTSNDVINATNGNNTVTGLSGDDQLNGLAGNDTYRYNLGDGNDTIVDVSGTDAIEFGAGINPSDIRIQKYQINHMQILLKDGSFITVQNAFDASGNFTANAIESIRFADNSVWDENTIKIESQKIPSVILTGTAARDFLTGAAGDDILTGAGGIDLIKGGLGNDRYIYNLGDGEDAILDVSGTDSLEFGSGITESDIKIKKFATNHLVVTIKGNESLVLLNVLDDAGNYTTNSIESFTFSNGAVWDFDKIKAEASKPASVFIDGKSTSETLQGFDGDDVITGMRGQDTLQGGNGGDTYIYRLGDGSDTISDTSGVDEIVLGQGINPDQVSIRKYQTNHLQIVFANGGNITVQNALDSAGQPSAGFIENIVFSDNQVWNAEKIVFELNRPLPVFFTGSSTSENIIGGDGADQLTGNKGDDLLNGKAGDDRYFYNLGDGSDVIDDISGVDRLIFGAGVKSNEIRIRQESNDLQILFKDGNTITVKNALSNGNLTDAAIESFVFSDGSNWDTVKIQQEINKPFSQTFDGNLLPQYFFNGNQTIVGGVGDDIIIGAKGDDTISGGVGNDTYYWNLGDGVDYIDDISGVDRIVFGEGVDPDTIKVYFKDDGYGQSDSLVIGDVVIFNNSAVSNFLDSEKLIESVEFANGITWTANDIYQKAISFVSSERKIYGSTANDYITINTGVRSVNGSNGDDTYFYEKGKTDYVTLGNSSGNGTLVFGDDIFINDLSFQILEYGALLISLKSGEAINAGVNRIEFNDGSVYTIDDLRPLFLVDDVNTQYDLIPDNFIEGASGQDILYGTISGDQIKGGGGHDQLSGGLGGDVLYGEAGDDTLLGGFGNDRLYGGIGNDRLFSNSPTDPAILVGINMTRVWDYLYGEDGDDYLLGGYEQYGGPGNDTLVAGDRPIDTIYMAGGNGNDTYFPSAIPSNDVYWFSANQIYDEAGFDTVVFPEEISLNNLFLTSSGLNRENEQGKLSSFLGFAHYNYNFDDDLFYSFNTIEQYRFSDGTVMSAAELVSALNPKSSTKIGTYGNDDFYIASSNSEFHGSKGDDRYFYSYSAGSVYIKDVEGFDQVVLQNVNSYDVALSKSSSIWNIIIDYEHSLSIDGVEKIQFADGVILNSVGTQDGEYEFQYPLGYEIKQPLISSYFDGYSLGVSAKPGLMIKVFYQDNLVGSGSVSENGLGYVSLSTRFTNNENLVVLLQDELGNESLPLIYVAQKDIIIPVQPTGFFDPESRFITGHAESGTAVQALQYNGLVISEVYANGDGNYQLYIPEDYEYSTIEIKSKDSAGNISSALQITIPNIDPPTAQIDSSGKVISGVAVKGSTVVITNSNGEQVVSVVANATTGNYAVSLPVAQINNQTINVFSIDSAGYVSNSTSVIAPDRTAPILSSASFNVTADIVYGVTEAGATVVIKNSSGVDLASAVADADGQYVVHLPAALTYNTSVTVRVTDAAGNASTQTILTPDYLPPLLSTASFDTAGKIISGTADKGSTIVVKNASGTQIGTATANAATGVYSITLSTALINKQVVSVTAKDAAGNISDVINIIAPDKTAPVVPTALFDASGQVITGIAEMGSTVMVKNSSGTQIGSGSADATTGNYTVTLSTALINKETVNVTATDDVGNISTAKSIIAPDLTPPSKPTATFNSAGKIISGTAEKSSTVIVTNADGIQIGSATANSSSGSYSITLTTALINKEVVNVVAKDAAGNISAVANPMAPDLTVPVSPTALFDATGKIITGVAEIGSTVIVKNSSGTQIGTTTADATTGNYTVTLATALINKQTVNVTAKDVAGNVSAVKAIIAPDLTAPATPSASINTTGTTITGSAEKNSTVIVKTAAGVELGSAVATTTSTTSTTGTFTITLSAAQINKEVLRVTAVDIAGNISPVLSVTAPDKTPPAAPTAVIDSTGKIITGIAEIGSTVIVKNSSNSQIGSVTANATTGAYTITLSTAITVGQTVNVTAKDAAGNVSGNTALTRPAAVARIPDSDVRVEQLIQAMASFAPPSGIETNVLSGFDDRSNHVIAVGQ